jgi:alkylation response protein AidB-like acyl-CoA dehydrogenase
VRAIKRLGDGRVSAIRGGYRLSDRFAFASGINHSRLVLLGGLLETGAHRETAFLVVGAKDFKIVDCWFTAAMRATGSNTVVCDDVFVPERHVMRLSELREGRALAAPCMRIRSTARPSPLYAPLIFVAPMLGAAQGAYEEFRGWTKTRLDGRANSPVAEITSAQVRLARFAADPDAVELLMRRAVDTAQSRRARSLNLRARSMRDFSRSTELCIGAIDTLIGMSGTAAFAVSHPIQHAWRDIHFAAMHVSLNSRTTSRTSAVSSSTSCAIRICRSIDGRRVAPNGRVRQRGIGPSSQLSTTDSSNASSAGSTMPASRAPQPSHSKL